jgi:tetratricopeptide (TPR) repeat protein
MGLLLGALSLASTARAHDGPLAHNNVDGKIKQLTDVINECEEHLKRDDAADASDKLAAEERKKLVDELAASRRDRGSCYLEIREYETALADFDGWLALYPASRGAHGDRGYARYKMGDWKGALEDFDVACVPSDAKPWMQAWLFRGQVKRELGDEKGALADTNTGIAAMTKSKWPTAYCMRGEIEAALGDEKGALEDFESALKLDPRHVDSLVARARLRTKHEDTQKSGLEDLEAAAEYARDDGRPLGERAKIERQLGWGIQARGHGEAAVDLFRRQAGFARSPGNKAALLLEAAKVAAEAILQRAAALELLDEAQKLAPERPDVCLYRVKVLEDMGDKAALADAHERLARVAKTRLPAGALDVAVVGSNGR